MNTNMIKRKRLDARSFREWHMSNYKKHKEGSSPEQGNMTYVSHNDKVEASCSRKGSNESDNFHLQQHREDSNSKSQPENGEATVEQYGCIVPDSSSMDMHLNGKTPDEVVEDGVIGPKHVPLNSPESPDKMLSSAESGSDGKRKEEMEGESKFKGKPEELRSSLRFDEYWVPASFSYLQLEKYCQTLIKHGMFLCAKTKNGLTNLDDVLIKGRECCDHPYLLDSSLERCVNEHRPVVDYLTNGIEASGKLLLLDKFLQELKGKGFRVVIIFQSNRSKSKAVELRHLLDDTIRQRFGEESYVHIYRDFDRSKKLAACDLFNDKETGRFVMLMEKCSCQSNIKLLSVDFVILFNSDWSPNNDIRCLRKISIQSTDDHLKVLRLYSSNTLEEKVLTLAKEGTSLESNMNTFSRNVCHMLLLWGATYLFIKLDDFHRNCTSINKVKCLTEDKLVLDVFDELMLLCCQDGKECNFSLISKVPEGNGEYPAGISGHGMRDAAMDDDIPPWAIWSSLLDEKNPQWILLPSSDNIRRRGEFPTRLSSYSECGKENEMTTSNSTSPSRDKLVCQKSKSKNVFRPLSKRKEAKLAGPTSGSVGKKLSPCRDGCNGTHRVEEACTRRMRELLLKQKKEIREFYQDKREERAKLEEEHQLELDLINQGCKEAGVKKEELERLDHIYEQKIEKHNREMDMKRKDLEDVQLASRIKEKKVKEKLIAKSRTKYFEWSVSSLVNGQSLADSSENDADAPPITVSDQNKHSDEVEQDIGNESLQRQDPRITPDCSHKDTEILSLGSDGESDGASIPRKALSSTPVNNSSPIPLESDGENDVMMLPNEEGLDHGSNSCTSNKPQLCALSGQDHLQQGSNATNRVVLDRDCSMEACGEALNGELDNLATVDESQGEQEQAPAELPSSRITCVSPVVGQSQAGTTLDGSLPLEQPLVSPCLPINEVRQNAETTATYNSQTSETLGSSQLDHNQFPSRVSNYNPPSLHPPVQSFMGRDQTHNSSAAYTPTMQSPNSHFQEFPSVRSNTGLSTCVDPLENELGRIRKEEEEAKRIHEEKTMEVNLAHEKEVEELRKKYNLLRQEADVEYLQKNVVLESVRRKVLANKWLSDTLKYYNQKPQSHLVSQEALMSAILELPILQQCNTSSSTQRTSPTSVVPIPAQVQVVHQLSDLMSFDPVRLQNSSLSPSCVTLNPLTGHQVRAPAPHLRPFGLMSQPRPNSGITSLTGRPNQATHVSNWTRPYLTNSVLTYSDGSPSNPVVL